ncbi:Crp/Fnr family transcriptional regulator [Maribacter polysiphoniae]|uniref:CRP-like cAMP-binding protein n=1 Tax=Maribacter polysiphoniae TaxID=429344 RepID=A0A316E3A3_9FLAO|nr:Crp/Fnr family transcriptional regulator [Maribacter polysiphoniae]MBD1258982.1 Crp/Fnr family transcriptional regulator [Maribacter polysiphoniae]PWK24535.1 CRP-like cAMP-binding protein [Maribacter polysiphoniae]
MYDKLIDHIHQNTPGPGIDKQIIAEYFTPKCYGKKEHFLKQGYICRLAGFVIEGCSRNYMLSTEGKEVNIGFNFENWWIGDVCSFVNQTPSLVNTQFLENTTLLTITAKNHLDLLNKSQYFREYTNKLRSKATLASVQNLSGLSESAKTRYRVLLEKYPKIQQRVSQKHIASFLQITPEALCRLRKSEIS